MKFTAFLFSLLLLIGCKPNKTSSPAADNIFIDSVLNEHFQRITSLPYYDTANYDFQTLKAYYNKNTSYFKQLLANMEYDRSNRNIQEYMDTCVHQLELMTMPADEAYRFIYMQAFAPNKINITVYKKGDSINLHLVVFRPRWEKEACRIIKEYDKKLTAAEWNSFMETIQFTDFWGMKKDNDIHGVDGSSLLAYGYIKGDPQKLLPARSHSIYRWSPSLMAIYEPFFLLLKLSGNTENVLGLDPSYRQDDKSPSSE